MLQKIRETNYSRYPVYGETVDDILGLLYVKDLLGAMVQGKKEDLDLMTLVREPMVVPENMPVPDVLVAMKRNRMHQAIVASEYGGVDGVVTLEDIVEEVFGPIYDEHDDENEEFTTLPDGNWVVDGSFTLHDLHHELGIDLHPVDDPDYETVAGLLMAAAGKVPEPGFQHIHDGVAFKVLKADATRVLEVRIQQRDEDAEGDGNDDAAPNTDDDDPSPAQETG